MPGKSKTVVIRRPAPGHNKPPQKVDHRGSGWDGSNAKTNPHITPPANPNVPIGKQVH